MDAAQTAGEGSSKRKGLAEPNLKVYSKKKKKDATALAVQLVSLSDEEDNLTLSQLSKLRSKTHVPVTPMKIEARLQLPQTVVADEPALTELCRAKRREGKKKLLPEQPDVLEPTASTEEPTIPDQPYSYYLSLMGQLCDLTVRMIHWWKGRLYGSNSPESIIFLVVDAQGYKVQGYVPPYLARSWAIPVQKEAIYRMTSVTIIEYNKHVQLVDAPIQIQPTETTSFEILPPDDGHPQISYSFAKLSLLHDFLANQTAYKDILAVVTDIRPTVSRMTKAKDRVVEFAEAFLTDATIYPKCIALTVWQESIAKYPVFSNEFVSPFLIQGTGLKTNIYRGNLGFQTTNFTELEFVDVHKRKAKRMLKRIAKIKKRLAKQSPYKLAYSGIASEVEQPLATIAELVAATQNKPDAHEAFSYTIIASVFRIYTELPTTYRGCILCNTSMRDPQFDSSGCMHKGCTNRDGKAAYRYKLIAAIRDSTGTIDITIFNSLAEELLRIPAPTFRSLLLEDDNGPSRLDELFRKVYSKPYKFGFKITAASFGYTGKVTYTLQQLEWIPKAFDTPEVMLSEITQMLLDQTATTSNPV